MEKDARVNEIVLALPRRHAVSRAVIYNFSNSTLNTISRELI